jgi:alkanesulfonate monooxygenase SsuD/methylene tetrahydromethanopterin reductase-like flavin-dependent oxidoreductase (luciferase family)
MDFGFYIPNFGPCGDARVLADLAALAEACGWDGVFLWDHLQFVEPAVDPWVALTAMALGASRIRLGPLVTPLPRRHPAKLAREVVSLDRLSAGRVTLGLGAGFPLLPDYAAFGDEPDRRVRAAMLDEGLEVLARLLSGEPVSHRGAHYRIECPAFAPPVQRPHPPIWIAAQAGAARPLRRAVRWDGVAVVGERGLDIDAGDLAAITDFARRERAGRPFDVVRFGMSRDAGDTALAAASAKAGATWWVEHVHAHQGSRADIEARIRRGPPRP